MAGPGFISAVLAQIWSDRRWRWPSLRPALACRRQRSLPGRPQIVAEANGRHDRRRRARHERAWHLHLSRGPAMAKVRRSAWGPGCVETARDLGVADSAMG